MSCEKLDSGQLVFLKDQVGLFRSDQLPDLAADLLVRGYDSPSLRELAGRPRNDPAGARDLWLQVRAELNRPVEDDDLARRRLIRYWLCQIADGIDPISAASLLYTHGWMALDRPEFLKVLVDHLDNWIDMPQISEEEMSRKLAAAARAILQRW
ncbi:hypothetical protein QF047_004163 [Arthrobacter sp. W4I7]|nr:hypothetical protein [Arthrobacter sp. W4I7]